MQWVLDWNRIANLLVVLVPFFLAVGGSFRYFINRSDARAERIRVEAEKKELELDEARDKRRAEEMEEMRVSRQAFYADILTESRRMRELYEAELDRGIALRTALAEAGRREILLQETIGALNDKVDRLQEQVTTLRQELEKTREQAALALRTVAAA
jgi:hypothetical protein